MHDWMVDRLSDPLTALFAVDVTDIVVDWLKPDWMVDWVSDSLTALFAVNMTDLVVDWLIAWLSGWLS